MKSREGKRTVVTGKERKGKGEGREYWEIPTLKWL